MQELSVVGVEDGVLILESPSGERFTVPVASLPESRSTRQLTRPSSQRRLSPRDVQILIRSGLTVDEVAAQSGDDPEYIRRFEGPVLAERQHALDTALSVPVRSGDIDPLGHDISFGQAIEERLDELGATTRSWSSKKPHEGGWLIELAFTTEQVAHEATWAFDPRKLTLVAQNREATALSRSGDATSVLVPRLRAVDAEAAAAADAAAPADKDAESTAQRFDSGAFRVERGSDDAIGVQPASVEEIAVQRAPEAATTANHTADLLEALRRRRGEREAALDAAALAEHDPEDDPALFDEVDADADHSTPLHPKPKRQRAAMPSWDEIVFGSRPDDER